MNNQYAPVTINFVGNVRLFDIAPRMYATITISSADNPRGIALTDVRLIPRRVEMGHDPETGEAQTAVTFEFEAVGVDGVTYVPPVPVLDNGDVTPPDFGSVDIPGLDDYFPPFVPGDVVSCPNGVFTVNSFSAPWSKSIIYGTDADTTAKVYFPCVLHPSFPTGTTSSVTLNLTFGGDANYSLVTLYAFKGGSRVATASGSGAERTFSLVSTLDIDGFEIELSAGEGTVFNFTLGSIVASGTVLSIGGAVSTQATVAGQYYAIDGSGGPWSAYPVGDPNHGGNYYWYAYDSARSSGGVGWIGDSGTNTMALQNGTLLISSAAISSRYARGIFLANETAINIKAGNDPNPIDNTGSISFTLRNVTATGRRIGLGSLRIDNVCPA